MGLRKKLKKLLFKKSLIDITAEFPAYSVTGAGSHELRTKLSTLAINQMPGALKVLEESLSQK